VFTVSKLDNDIVQSVTYNMLIIILSYLRQTLIYIRDDLGIEHMHILSIRYSASSVIRTPLFQAPEKSIHISEFVWINEAH